jgi:ubiquitin C-terminal hydrolase
MINKMGKFTIPPLGFQNTGAICYFNSLMQCLLSSSQFIKFIVTDKQHPDFIQFFANIFKRQSWDPLFTTHLLHRIGNGNFLPNQSSSEYFLLFMDTLRWDHLFECRYQITKDCQGCSHHKESTDVSYNVLINDTVDEFIKTDAVLDGLLCDGCKVKTTYHQRQMIYSVSPIIVLSFNKYFGKKQIDYPPQLEIGSLTYRLIGTIEHTGGLYDGHYTARVRRVNGEDVESYYKMDDASVLPITKETFEHAVPETYMVFYERVEN